MSKIEEQIKKLREEEERLKRETRKVEFLNHILSSAKEYEHVNFKDVKIDVLNLLEDFVKKSIESIEDGGKLVLVSTPSQVSAHQAPSVETTTVVAPVAVKKPQGPMEASPAEKMSFALENRMLAGKKVQIENDKNLEIKGEVVGLDAPHVIVKVDGGPTIKVPREKVALV